MPKAFHKFSSLLDAEFTEHYLEFFKEAVKNGYLLPHEAAACCAYVAGQLYSKAVWQAQGFLEAAEGLSFQEVANKLISIMNEGSLYEASRVKDGVHPQVGDVEGEGVYLDVKARMAIEKARSMVRNRRVERGGGEETGSDQT
jgi:hypothetical protein